MSNRLLIWLLFTGCLLAPPAYAEHPSAADGAFARGLGLFNAGDYTGAVEAYQQAYAAEPSYRTLYNLGLAYRKLGRAAETVRAFERFLSEGGDSIDALLRRDVRELVDELRAQLGTIRFVGAPQGAVVRVDGTKRELEPPRSTLLVSVGMHRVVVELAGHEPTQADITVPSREEVVFEAKLTPLAVALPPAPEATQKAPSGTSSSLRTLGYVTGAAGLVATTIGVIAGLQASSKLRDSNEDCDELDYCGAQGREDRNAALRAADISTVSFVVGGVLLAGSVTLIVLGAPGESAAAHPASGSPRLRVARRLGLELTGQF